MKSMTYPELIAGMYPRTTASVRI